MGYQYNDAEMMLATQIAYLDISGEDVSVRNEYRQSTKVVKMMIYSGDT